MSFELFQKNIQDKESEIAFLVDDSAMHCAASRAYEDLDRFYLNSLKIDALIEEMHELAKVYYDTKNKKR